MTGRQGRAQPTDGGGIVIGVLGASGGVGASTLATACAVRAADAGREVTLVDGHPWGGGLDVLAGMDLQPGLRWADLRGIRGDVDAHRLVGELPVDRHGLRCLSWGSHLPGDDPPGPEPVLSAVRAASQVIVVDLPRPAAPPAVHQEWWSACDEVLLIVDATVTGIGAATVLAEHVSPTWLVLRSPSSLPDEVIAATLGVPVLVRLGEDRSVRVCLESGAAVGSGSGPLAAAADQMLAEVLPGLRAA